LRLVEQAVAPEDTEAKALACYGLLLRNGSTGTTGPREPIWLRFVDGRPVSAVTTAFLAWCCKRLERAGRRALLLVWDNASWQRSQIVRTWVRDHNRRVKRDGHGVRILACPLPTKSPWLNPIEPRWLHTKRRVLEADGGLTLRDLADRVCATLGATHEPYLTFPNQAA
jgi:hypothetical protein